MRERERGSGLSLWTCVVFRIDLFWMCQTLKRNVLWKITHCQCKKSRAFPQRALPCLLSMPFCSIALCQMNLQTSFFILSSLLPVSVLYSGLTTRGSVAASKAVPNLLKISCSLPPPSLSSLPPPLAHISCQNAKILQPARLSCFLVLESMS